MNHKNKLTTLCITTALTLLLSACGSNAKDDTSSSPQPTNTPAETAAASTPTANADADKSSRKIADQSFVINLPSIGEAEFVSYAPDVRKNSSGDVTFEIVKDNKTVQELEGMADANILKGMIFEKVEAVSFKDYNNDGTKDLITITQYKKEQKNVTQARIYKGDNNGKFTLEKKMSNDANEALAEKTVQSVLDFLGVDHKKDTGWKQAYIDVVTKDKKSTPWAGYALIYLDDDQIPELVKIGSSEAMGCKIVNYSKGKAHETQLNRLNFTYIPKKNLLCNSDGNMDHYYDLIYSIVDGKMKLKYAGYYGAEDNKAVELDKDEKPVYQYKWNDQIISMAEYQKQLKAVYDGTKALGGYYDGEYFDADGVIKQIKDL